MAEEQPHRIHVLIGHPYREVQTGSAVGATGGPDPSACNDPIASYHIGRLEKGVRRTDVPAVVHRYRQVVDNHSREGDDPAERSRNRRPRSGFQIDTPMPSITGAGPERGQHLAVHRSNGTRW